MVTSSRDPANCIHITPSAPHVPRHWSFNLSGVQARIDPTHRHVPAFSTCHMRRFSEVRGPSGKVVSRSRGLLNPVPYLVVLSGARCPTPRMSVATLRRQTKQLIARDTHGGVLKFKSSKNSSPSRAKKWGVSQYSARTGKIHPSHSFQICADNLSRMFAICRTDGIDVRVDLCAKAMVLLRRRPQHCQNVCAASQKV